jgi:hypothetical protein
MSAEERALASGALEKELRSGHWRKSENRCGSECSQSSYCRSAKEVSLECRRTVLCYQRAFVGVVVKPVGKPDALVGHVRFDERGRETGRLPVGSDHAPFLDSTSFRSCACVELWRRGFAGQWTGPRIYTGCQQDRSRSARG